MGPSVAAGRSGQRRWSGTPAHFFDAPLGHGATRHRFRGRRPLRTCPRLISSGVAPGREPGGHALPKGNHRRGNGVPNSFGCGAAAMSDNSAKSSRAVRILPWRGWPAQPAANSFPSHSFAPNSPAQFGRAREPLHPVRHAGRRPCDCGALPSAPSRSAFLPISAVFHSAPPRSERFLKTPQRSEGTQSGKGRQRVPRTHCGSWQSFASTLAALRAPRWLRPGHPVLQLFRILARREDFSRSAAVCAEHQPQPVGPRRRL